jgi:hypothetical protein
MNTKSNENLVTLPLRDLIWNILGDESNGAMCNTITLNTAIILDNLLKNSLKWKVEFNNKDGEPLKEPVLWRYSEWKASNDTYTRQKLYAHKERVTRWIKDKNVDDLARAIAKETKMTIEVARPIAASVFRKGNVEVLNYLGLKKIITREEEL